MADAITITLTVPLRRILDIIANALDSGAFAYWIDRNTLDEEWPSGWTIDCVTWIGDDEREWWRGVRRCYFAPLIEGGALTFALEDSDGIEGRASNRCRLDLPAVRLGLQVMAETEPRHFADLVDGNDDATTADVFIQCCVLREVVYG